MKERLINSLVIILGNTMLAIATSVFILPFNIDNGGLSGISVVLERWFNPAVVIFVLNWVLFFLGLIFLKKDFALKTLLSTIVYPLVVNLIYYTNLAGNVIKDLNDPLLASIMAAILIGTGLGLVYKVGGSTGGVDVISVMLHKYLGIKISHSTFMIDSIIVALGLFMVSVNSSLYGIICVIIASYLIEVITIKGNSSYMMHIVSDKMELINDYIINELERGSTIISAKGGIRRDEKEMIEVIFNEKEYYKIKHEIQKIDKDAFLSVYKAVNVYGNGFEMISRK
ncbi:MAG: YitT family protein [Bacilli bacterium]|nr:YitT family protein [Bacilli bacterium]